MRRNHRGAAQPTSFGVLAQRADCRHPGTGHPGGWPAAARAVPNPCFNRDWRSGAAGSCSGATSCRVFACTWRCLTGACLHSRPLDCSGNQVRCITPPSAPNSDHMQGAVGHSPPITPPAPGPQYSRPTLPKLRALLTPLIGPSGVWPECGDPGFPLLGTPDHHRCGGRSHPGSLRSASSASGAHRGLDTSVPGCSPAIAPSLPALA